MKINELRLNGLHNDAHFQFYAEIRTLVEETTPAALKIEAGWLLFIPAFENYDAALRKIIKSAITDQIKDADAARDAAFAAFAKFLAAMCEHYDTKIRNAALKVHVVAHTYGNVAAKPINEETSAVYNLVQELKSENYRTAVTLIGLMPWVNKLGTLNTDFESLIQERDRENEAKSHISMKTARRNIDDTYKNIVKTINSLIYLNQLTEYETFVDTYNIVVKRFNTLLKQQQSISRHHGKGGGTGGTDDGNEE